MNVNYSATNEQCWEKRHDDGAEWKKKLNRCIRSIIQDKCSYWYVEKTTKYAQPHWERKKQSEREKINVKPYKTVFICNDDDDDGDDATTLSPRSGLNVHVLHRWHTKNNFVFIYISWIISLTIITSRSQRSFLLFFSLSDDVFFSIRLIYIVAHIILMHIVQIYRYDTYTNSTKRSFNKRCKQ